MSIMAINTVCHVGKADRLLDKEANEIDWLDALISNCLNEELISSLNICESDNMLTFHDCTEGYVNSRWVFCQLPAVDWKATNNVSFISMEVTLLVVQS